MSFRLSLLSLLGAGLLAMPAVAQPPEKPADKPPAGDSAMKQKILAVFDTNNDGQLDRSERQAMRAAMMEHFGGGPDGRGRGPGDRAPEGRRRPDGPPPGEGRGPEGRRGRGPGSSEARGPDGSRGSEGRGPDRRGPEGRRGPGGPDGPPPRMPNPERLFNRFDEDKDGSLSKEEFLNFTKFMREHRPQGPPTGMRGGPGSGEGRGFGPPARGEFDRRGGGEGRRTRRPDGPPGPPNRPEGPTPPADGPDDAI